MSRRRQRGFTYLGLLFAVVVSSVLLAGAGQVWHVQAQRDKEAELLFIGREFGRALASYAAIPVQPPEDAAGGDRSGAFPDDLQAAQGSPVSAAGATPAALSRIVQAPEAAAPDAAAGSGPERLEQLVEDNRIQPPARHLRRIYRDPMTGRAEWGLIRAGTRIVAVHSLSDGKALRRIPGAKRPGATPHEADDVRYSDWRFGAGFVPPERGAPVFVRPGAGPG